MSTPESTRTAVAPAARVAHRRRLRCAGLLLLGLGAFAAGVATAESRAARLGLYALPFTWRDEAGALWRLQQLRGHAVLLTMAYSTCRQTCSYALHRLEGLQAEAQRRGIAVDVVVLSYDPTLDNPDTWSRYRRRHQLLRNDWHFLTANAQATRQTAELLGIRYWNYDEHVIHDFRILLLDSAGQVTATLSWANRHEDIFASARGLVAGPVY